MDQAETIYICMGSACHQFGVYDVLPILLGLIDVHKLENRVVLKGAFCLGPCMNGIILKMDDKMIFRVNAQNIEQKFVDEILPYLKPGKS